MITSLVGYATQCTSGRKIRNQNGYQEFAQQLSQACLISFMLYVVNNAGTVLDDYMEVRLQGCRR